MKLALLSVFSIAFCAGEQKLPSLTNNLCDLDTIYNQIRTGNVVEVTLEVRYRTCPSNRNNLPCDAMSDNQGYTTSAPGPSLDGVSSEIIMINDSTPGPEIRANLGDTIRVTVVNMLQEPTTMHFHGITQFRTPYMDGTDGITNCPIPHGYSHTYEFIAHPAGSTFYHSHTASQRVSGMTGSLIIVDPAEEAMNEKTVFLQDWYHQSPDDNFGFWAQNWPGNCISFGGNYFTGILNPKNPGNPFVGAVVGDGMFFQSFLVNGEGIYDYNATQVIDALGTQTFQDMGCPGQTANAPLCNYCLNQNNWTSSLCKESSADTKCGNPHVIEVKTFEKTRLRFIHAGSLYAAQVCIDGHTVDIIAADGSPVVPYTTDCFLIFSAERYDAVVTPQKAGDYWIRFTTLEQQTASSFNPPSTANLNMYTDNFPHHGYAILRVRDSPGSPIPANYAYLPDRSPITCDRASINCGANYWFNSSTMGCAVNPSKLYPNRCVTAFEALKPASSPNDDASICGDLLMAHQVDPNVQFTATMGFLPDGVPRWDGMSMNSRIEILPEADWGFPYITPEDDSTWGAHQPISFANPDTPTLSLPPDVRKEVYSYRRTFREIGDPVPNVSLGPPAAPEDFQRGVLGPSAVMVNYGDVIRVYFSCAEPYGPGCAMPHPMHLHGHRMAILYVGAANETYDESKLNLVNPLYRDVVNVNTDSFVVVQIAAVNPGAWRLHCHVDIHHRSGMAFILDVGGDEAVEEARATPTSANLCAGTKEMGYTTSSDGSIIWNAAKLWMGIMAVVWMSF